MELIDRYPIFIGFKMDTSLKRELAALEGSDRKYVSKDDTSFLVICTLGGDQFVGKLVEERMTTDRVEDVQRNVLSILQRICPEKRFPQVFQILPCDVEGPSEPE